MLGVRIMLPAVLLCSARVALGGAAAAPDASECRLFSGSAAAGSRSGTAAARLAPRCGDEFYATSMVVRRSLLPEPLLTFYQQRFGLGAGRTRQAFMAGVQLAGGTLKKSTRKHAGAIKTASECYDACEATHRCSHARLFSELLTCELLITHPRLLSQHATHCE